MEAGIIFKKSGNALGFVYLDEKPNVRTWNRRSVALRLKRVFAVVDPRSIDELKYLTRTLRQGECSEVSGAIIQP